MSWRFINSVDLVRTGIIGRTIAKMPDGDDQYEVKSVQLNGYVIAFHADWKLELKILPDDRLIRQMVDKEINHSAGKTERMPITTMILLAVFVLTSLVTIFIVFF